MEEKRTNRLLLYLIGFLCGRGAILGITPFIIPLFAAVFFMGKGTLGLLIFMMLGGVTIYLKTDLGRFCIFEACPFAVADIDISFTYFLSKYLIMIFLMLLCFNGLQIIAKHLSKKEDGVQINKETSSYVMITIIVFATSLFMGFGIYQVDEAFLMAFFEMMISVCMVPIFKRAVRVIIFDEHEPDKYNEELLGVLVMVAVCLWGIPVMVGDVLSCLLIFGLYISWYTIKRLGASYGMAVTGVAGVIAAIKYGQPELVGSIFIIGVMALAGRILSEKRKIGIIASVALACAVTGLLYYDYFLTVDGLKTVGVALALLIFTPKRMLSARDDAGSNPYNIKTAAEMNRITAEKIRELSGAFKRIEFTLAGCGPAAAKISLGQVGEMIGRFSDNLETAETVPAGSQDLLRTEFLEQGVVMSHLSTMKNEMNHRQFYVTARTKNKRIMMSKDAAEIMSEVFKQPIRVSEDTSAIISENDRVITFEEAARYRCSYAVRRIKKYGSNVSGDNFSVKEHEDGRLVMMISDGMGSGSLASCESTLMIDTMEELMEAGFEPELGISFSNNCISAKNNGRSFTTFDMGIIDLYEGTLSQYKQGAAPTFIIHTDGEKCLVRSICGETLPIGVLPETKCDVVKTNLKDGDIIVMASDGVTCEYDDMEAILKDIASSDCREMLDNIISDVLRECDGRLNDDATVIVARITENYEG